MDSPYFTLLVSKELVDREQDEALDLCSPPCLLKAAQVFNSEDEPEEPKETEDAVETRPVRLRPVDYPPQTFIGHPAGHFEGEVEVRP